MALNTIVVAKYAVCAQLARSLSKKFDIQYLVKSVRAEATPKMTFFAKMLYKSHTINSKALKNIRSYL